MGSIEKEPLMGEFVHPLIKADTKNDDPWQRNYGQPPNLGTFIPRSYPLSDLRPLIESPNYDPTELLRTHGFSVVKNSSPFLAQRKKEDIKEEELQATYYPEIEELVKRTTGAKDVLIRGFSIRQGQETPTEFVRPTGLKSLTGEKEEEKRKSEGKPRSTGFLGKPIRLPHTDSTPLGARQHIRSDNLAMRRLALDRGIIAAEDKLVEGQAYSATSEEANAIIAERYNENGLGTRYAAFSIWRPLSKVGRDPIAVAQRGDEKIFAEEFVHWPYLNKFPGTEELEGEYLREFSMLGLQSEKPKTEEYSAGLKWYYVSEQRPDEVLFIKLFDSAALGEGGHAGAPYHASPEIGNVQGGNARESLELRIFAFW